MNACKAAEKKPVLVMVLSQETFFLSHFSGHAECAIRNGFTVIVVAKQTEASSVRQIERMGCKFVNSLIDRSDVGLGGLIRGFRRLRAVYNRYRPDVVHHFGTKSILLGTLACFALKKRPLIINNLIGLGLLFCRSSLKACLVKTLVMLGYRFLLNPQNSKVICENKDDLRLFAENHSLRLVDAYLIPGAGVDIERFSPVPWIEKQKKITVIMCSRLLKTKGVVTFLEAAEKLQKQEIPVQMWLVGDVDAGNDDSLSLSELMLWKEKKVCKIYGFRRDVAELLKMAHIYVLPSYYREGLPKALLEAAASGLAIVTTDTVGCRDVVEKNGILIDSKNSDCLVSAIKFLIENPLKIKEMGVQSRLRAENLYAREKILEKVMAIYNTVR